ncbi:hypothetical protein CIW54_27610 [Paraburkholderia sp. T12-10]|nr:hypothetical protein CIW54_27610 [Paraburkholderia sp. T12-10]
MAFSFQRALFSMSPRRFPRGADAPEGALDGGPRQPAAISGALVRAGAGGGCAQAKPPYASATLHKSKPAAKFAAFIR